MFYTLICQKWVHAAKAVSCSLRHMEICHENDQYDVILTAGGSLPTTLPPAATVLLLYLYFTFGNFTIYMISRVGIVRYTNSEKVVVLYLLGLHSMDILLFECSFSY